jgi:acetylornithine deacetylase/succinyl-diaminopimelate desuccinylase-like protein
MIVESVRVNPNRSESMSVGAKTAIIEHLGRQHQAMVDLLADLVNIDSGSYNKRGVDAVGDRLRAWLEAAGISCEIFPSEIFGDCMAARIPGSGSGNRPIVLLGHRDTVFPDGTAAQRPFRIDGDQAFGPGVADMKAGLVMNTFVLESLRRFGAPCPLTGLHTSDEEIASPSSRPVIEAEAKDARAVFNAEPGRPSGNLVSRRKGAAFIELEVTGRAAHSGAAHAQGVSAIEALARNIQRLHRLTDYDLGTTINVGLVQGGTAVNTVAARATAGSTCAFRPRTSWRTSSAKCARSAAAANSRAAKPASWARAISCRSNRTRRAASSSRPMAARRRVSASRLAPRRPAVPQTAGLPRRSARRPCAAPARSAAMPTATTSGAASTRWSPARKRWR